MLIAPHAIVALYTNVDAVAHIAAGFLAYAAVFQIVDCIQATSGGALRGIKDTRVPMLITVAAYWVIGLPLARSEEHTSELQSLMRISYAVFCLKKQK